MNNERFAVPEILFHPSDIGIQEMGIPEAITHAVNCLPEGKICNFQASSLGVSVNLA